MGQVLGDTDSPKWPDGERKDENERGGEEEGWERMKKKKKQPRTLFLFEARQFGYLKENLAILKPLF